jgi:hypothetical protein
MRTVWARIRRWWPAACLAGLTLLLCGCATTETENLSERPWNAPKSWEHGLPQGLFEGR